MSDNPPPWPPPSWSAQDPNENYSGPPPTGASRPYPFEQPPPYLGQSFPPPAAPPEPLWVSRPGSVIWASTICYVIAGMLIVAAFVLVVGASIVRSIDNLTGSDNIGTTIVLIIAAIVNFGAAGLLIAGAAMFAGGRARGRQLLTIGTAICLVECVYWIFVARANTIFWTVLFVILSIVALALAWTKQTSEWLRVTMMPNSPQAGGYYQF